MIRHALGAATITVVIVLITLLPFLPGPYDPLAAPLSAMARVFGVFGLLLVPIGGLWIGRPRRGVPVAALIVLAIVWGVLSLTALIFSGLSLALAMLVLGVYLFFETKSRLNTVTMTPAVYLVAVPVAVFLLQHALVGRAVEFSRNRAIRSAETLIAGIERYRAAHGHYPASLLAVWADYKPTVIGIEKYQYEPSGQAYNLLFEQVARDLATREFVVYNPRDQQVVTSHAMDLLQYTPERLDRARGYFAVHSAPYAHWKYFWFD
jgi:hypothetical protein